MSSRIDNSALGESWYSWIGRTNQQLKDFQEKLSEQQKATIELEQELQAIKTTLIALNATVGNLNSQIQAISARVEAIDSRNDGIIVASVNQANHAEKIKALEENQNKVAWAVFGIFLAGVGTMLLNFSKIEHQLQHPSTPRSEVPGKSSPKL